MDLIFILTGGCNLQPAYLAARIPPETANDTMGQIIASGSRLKLNSAKQMRADRMYSEWPA